MTEGKVADLIVVDGDPLAEPHLLACPGRIWLVLQRGVPVAGRPRPGPARRPRRPSRRDSARRYAFAAAYLGGFGAVELTYAQLTPAAQARLIAWASTNVANLEHEPARCCCPPSSLPGTWWPGRC